MTSPATRAILTALWEAQGAACSICGERMPTTRTAGDQRNPTRPTIDHVFPKGLKGADARGNILAAHARCNGRKACNWPTEAEIDLLGRVNAILKWPDQLRREWSLDPLAHLSVDEAKAAWIGDAA